MLALLAKLCGDITVANNSDANQVFKLQEAMASAIINDPSLQIATLFQFEETENFSTQHLDADDMQHLSGVLQKLQDSPEAIDPTIRVFRREVPFVSSQLRGSVPAWGRGGRIVETIGPIFNRDGRRFWFDLYRVIPIVQVWLQGAARPFILLPLEVSDRITAVPPRKYKIPKGSVWINADLFAPPSPDNLYCGLTVAGGELNLTTPLSITADNKLVLPVGMAASVTLNLEQKEITDVSPDDHGIDAKETSIELPTTLSFTINHTGKSITAVGAKWNVYGQPINFTFNNAAPMRWVPELNRVAIPYKTDATELEIRQCKSPVCTISGKAKIADAAWVLSAAAININAPVQADGIGAMAVGVLDGLEVSWLGLKDANLFEKSFTTLKNAMVMVMPGRINIATLFASNTTGRQRYNLWQEPPVEELVKPVQYIDLFYTKQFFFFYDSLQKGTETISAQANCITSVNKPVKVDGNAFKVESLQTVFALSMSKALQIVMLYDDNILADNWSKTTKAPIGGAIPPVMFESTAIALNNALLTVSPVYGMLLYGDLKTEDSFDKCLLVFSFGLVQYLPTLPDPYAANVSFMKRKRSRVNNLQEPNRYFLAEINALLICAMNWENMNEPAVNFFLGDKPAAVQTTAAVLQPITSTRFDVLKNREALDSLQNTNLQRSVQLKTRNWQAVTDDVEGSARMLANETSMMMATNQSFVGNRVSPFRNAFALLDVSTNADLMGVSLGFANDNFIFERTHQAQPDMSGNPITISGLDVYATSRLVQIYALPQISWEPMINLSEVTNAAQDPFPGILYFLNDGVPAQIANTSTKPVNLAPIPLTKQITDLYNKENLPLWSYFTLPNGMLAVGMYFLKDSKKPIVKLIEEKFEDEVSTGLQIKTVGFFDDINQHKKFLGSAHQLPNINNLFFPATNFRSVLSGSVTEIFNDEFGTLGGFDLNKYIPLERYDFSGYGANVFSHWVNQNAALAQTSQAMFDVWRGRTAHEVIQVKSCIYPWGIRVVRTITIYRGANGFPWRTDSGWKAESDGIYDFRTPVKIKTDPPADSPALVDAKNEEAARSYIFHPGMVEGVYNVRNIKEDTTLAPFEKKWTKDYGVYIGDDGHPASARPPAPAQLLDVKLVPVYFDADVKIDDVTQGAVDGKVTSQRMLGYLQLRPRGVFIDHEDFAALLTQMNGLGGPVDCTVHINQSKQAMRISRVEVNPSIDAAAKRVFVAAAKGTPILPKDGSWSVVEHNLSTKEVLPLSGNDVIPIIRDGERKFPDITKLTYTQDKAKAVNVAEATELFKALEARAKQYGFLQSTGENKVLFRNPFFEKGADKDLLKSSVPDLADAYRLMNSKGVFPKLEDLPKITDMASDYVMNIKEEGYKLLNKLDPAKKLEQLLPKGPWYVVKTNDVKVYIKYESKDDNGNPKDAKLNLDIDSTAQNWLNKMNDISMYVDLGSFTELFIIRGKFDTAKGKSPNFIEPIMEFGPQLKPVYDILVLLSQLSINPNYKDILKAGLKIAMSNSPMNWEYKFQADKEIPLLRFPPANLDTAAAPLRLEAQLKAGVYFNVAIPLPPTNGIQAPSAGAFVEFYGKLSVMCVSVGVGTIYAVGQVTVRISADTVIGPALYMKFGFGVEAVVALPVIGSVSVYFAVGVEMSLDSTQITIGAFVLFRGRAEILGGIVTVTIQIEASGKVQDRIGGAGGSTTMIAQVTFSLDISICFIIDISFTEQWQEQKQVS